MGGNGLLIWELLKAKSPRKNKKETNRGAKCFRGYAVVDWDPGGPHPQNPRATPYCRLSVCQAQLHLHDVLRTQSQMGTEQGHED